MISENVASKGAENERFFIFLDILRESGLMNMCGAPKVLEDEFNLSKQRAMEVFTAWTKTYDEGS